MAGSLGHIVSAEGRFTMDYIENSDDARQALEECFEIIRVLTRGDMNRVNRVLDLLGYSTISADMQPIDIDDDISKKVHVDTDTGVGDLVVDDIDDEPPGGYEPFISDNETEVGEEEQVNRYIVNWDKVTRVNQIVSVLRAMDIVIESPVDEPNEYVNSISHLLLDDDGEEFEDG